MGRLGRQPFRKAGYAQMIYYTNIGTIAPIIITLFSLQIGTLVGQLSSGFVASLRMAMYFFWVVRRIGCLVFKELVSMSHQQQVTDPQYLLGLVRLTLVPTN